MGLRAQVVTEASASGAQVIDGCLRFVNTKLERTPSSAGNRRTFTYSVWVRRVRVGERVVLSSRSDDSNRTRLLFDASNRMQLFTRLSGNDHSLLTNTLIRDNSSFYHLVWSVDTTQSTASERVKMYVNGVEQTFTGTDFPDQNEDTFINQDVEHNIGNGQDSGGDEAFYSGMMSQVYLIDGQALEPTEFGFTDPLTNTWRPKKYTGTFGTNGFWLPFDGNSPIGEDKSGSGNNYKPVNFGGSAALDKATGAFPILNTVSGGKVATAGVRTDTSANNLVLALPLNDGTSKLDVSNQINSGSSEKTITIDGNTHASSDQSNLYGGSFEFDGSGDSLSAASSNDFGMGTGDFTVEAWVYPTTLNSSNFIVCLSGSDSVFGYDSDGTLNIQLPSSGAPSLTQLGPLITANKWNHFACVRESGNLRGYINGVLAATVNSATTDMGSSGTATIGDHPTLSREVTGYIQDVRIYKGTAKYDGDFVVPETNPDIVPDTPSGVAYDSVTETNNGSVSFDGDGDYLQVPNHADLRLGSDDFCVEAFVYYSETSGNGTIAGLWNSGANRRSWLFQIESDNRRLRGFYSTDGSSSTAINATTGQMTRNAWHHVAYTRSGNDLRIFLDGVEVGSATESGSFFNNTNDDIGVGSAQGGAAADPITGWISNVRVVKGSAIYTSDFIPPAAPLTNVTNTKLLCCQSNSSATTAAVIPTGSITANGNAAEAFFNPFDTDIHTVRGQESQYCVLTQASAIGGDGGDVKEGGLRFECPSSGDVSAKGTIPIPAGYKFYMEAIYDEVAGSGGQARLGIAQTTVGDTKSGADIYSVDFRGSAGDIQSDDEASLTDISSGVPGNPVTGDVVGIKVDLAAGTFRAHRNGIYYNGGAALITGIPNVESDFFTALDGGPNRNNWEDMNFGQKPWKYPPENGFNPLNSANARPDTVISRPDKYFGAVIYDGDGGSSNTVTGLSFKPDLVWGKCRTGDTLPHNLFDVVRGFDKQLDANDTAAEVDRTGDAVTPLSNGFILDATHCNINNGSTTNVAWCWKAGGAAVSNTDGSVTSQVSANQDAGFSIVSFTSTSSGNFTIGHGLGKTPKLIITKERGTDDNNWHVWHSGVMTTSSQFLMLNSTDGLGSFSTVWGTSIPTSLVFGATVGSLVNASTASIAYCWAEIEGYSKFGSYRGNNNSNGTYVNCGFKPAWVLIKRIDDTGFFWTLFDNVRRTINPNNHTLNPNNTNEEETGGGNGQVDFLSNGFKCRNTDGGINANGGNYIFLAFAESPQHNLYGASSNPR